MRWFNTFMTLTIAATLSLGQLGCTKVEKDSEEERPLARTATDSQILTIVIDMSGSYQQFMQQDGKAYRFMQRAVNNFYRHRIGSEDDSLILFQISANPRSALFEGHPRSLKSEFPTVDAFNKWLVKNSNAAGSRVHDSICDAITYTMGKHQAAGPASRSSVLVLSDMEDNFPESEESEKRLVALLREYVKHGGSVGMYFVAMPYLAKWRKHLKESGIRDWIVESDIKVDPALPRWDSGN